MRGSRPGNLFGTPALAVLEEPEPGRVTSDLLARMMLDNDLAGSWRSAEISTTPGAGTVLVAKGSTWRYRKAITANPPA